MLEAKRGRWLNVIMLFDHCVTTSTKEQTYSLHNIILVLNECLTPEGAVFHS